MESLTGSTTWVPPKLKIIQAEMLSTTVSYPTSKRRVYSFASCRENGCHKHPTPKQRAKREHKAPPPTTFPISYSHSSDSYQLTHPENKGGDTISLVGSLLSRVNRHLHSG
jgi:hypothetical protein